MSNLGDAILHEILRGNHGVIGDVDSRYLPGQERKNVFGAILSAQENGGVSWDNVRAHVNKDKSILFKNPTMELLKHLEEGAWGFYDEMIDDLKAEWMCGEVKRIGGKLSQAGTDACAMAEIWDLLEEARNVYSTGTTVEDFVQGKGAAEEMLTRSKEDLEEERIYLSTPIIKQIFGDYMMPRLYVISGYPSMGKNIVLDNLVVDFLWKHQGVYLSYDNTIQETIGALLGIMSGIPYSKIESNTLTVDDCERIDRVMEVLNRLFIVHRDYSASQIRAGMERMVKKHRVRFLVVDYFTMIRLPRRGDTTQQYEEAVKTLKKIASDFKVPVVVLSQRNKDGDLKWAKALFEGAYYVVSVHGEREESTRAVIVEKFKKGALRKVNVGYDGAVGALYGV